MVRLGSTRRGFLGAVAPALFVLFAPALSAQVANDECTGAIAVLNGANGPFSNVAATTSSPPWPCGAADYDLWFVYVPTCTGVATIDTCNAGFDTVLEVFDVCGTCPNFQPGVCNDDRCGVQSSVSVAVTLGTPFYLRVAGFGGDRGTFPVNVVCSVSGPNLPDDECAGATPVSLGLNAGFDNLRHTSSVPSWPCGLAGNDRWFVFVPSSSAEHTIHTRGIQTNFDTTLEVLLGPCGCGMTSVGCNDDFCGLTSSVTVALVANQPYYIRVGGYLGRTGRFDLVILASGSGSIQSVSPGCGGTALVPTGSPNLGGFLDYSLSPVSGTQQFVWAGLSPLALPICAGGCVLGCTLDVTVPGSTLSGPIPCAPELLGAQFYMQGADFGAAGGCAPNDPAPVPFTTSDTLFTIIGT